MKNVSIIIPVHNNQDGIEKLLLAISKQDYDLDRIEAIVVDNLSSPAISVPEEFCAFAKLIRCQKKGSYAARNTGVHNSTGKILAFIDADCEPQKEWISAGVNFLKLEAPNTILGGEVKIEKPNRDTPTALYQYITGFQQIKNISVGGFSVTANIFCDRETFNKVGLFDEDLLSGGDREWCLRAFTKGINTKFCPEAIVSTPPRDNIKSAITQARRVAAGRLSLKSTHPHITLESTSPYRGKFESAIWIIRHPELTTMQRFSVLTVATILSCVAFTEKIRILTGGSPEHR